MSVIQPGSTCLVTRDIGNSFRKGDRVVVEDLSPDPSRPEYMYVVLSQLDGKRYRLSDNDLVLEQVPAPRSRPPAGSARKGSEKMIGVILLISILLAGAVFGILYMLVWRDSEVEQPAVEQTQPASTEPSSGETTQPSRTYGTNRVSGSDYDRIQEGMSYSEVVSIFGGEGKKQSETGFPGETGHRVEYAWDGEKPGSAVFCTFEDDKLTDKRSEGL